jgi:L-ascorbate metabolism protein UlaG (beta-lactamase superfamily)
MCEKTFNEKISISIALLTLTYGIKKMFFTAKEGQDSSIGAQAVNGFAIVASVNAWRLLHNATAAKQRQKIIQGGYYNSYYDLVGLWNKLFKEKNDSINIVPMGHATTMISCGNYTIMTDPLLNQCFPFQRCIEFPCDMKEIIQPIDMILISHSHADHMDKNSINALYELNKSIQLIIPEGVPLKGIAIPKSQIHTLSHHDELKTHITAGSSAINITRVPAYHFSATGPFDYNEHECCGYVISYKHSNNNTSTIYFAGDTGYKDGLCEEIKNKFPHIDIAIMPIAPACPASLMHNAFHTNPNDIMHMLKILKPNHFFPIHWGTLSQGAHWEVDIIKWMKKNIETLKKDGITIDMHFIIGKIYSLFS